MATTTTRFHQQRTTYSSRPQQTPPQHWSLFSPDPISWFSLPPDLSLPFFRPLFSQQRTRTYMNQKDLEDALKKFRLGTYQLPPNISPTLQGEARAKAIETHLLARATADVSQGVSPFKALFQIPEHQQALTSGDIPQEKVIALRSLWDAYQNRQLSRTSFEQQVRALAALPATSSLGQRSESVALPTSTREERQAQIQAAEPRIQNFYERTAQNAGSGVDAGALRRHSPISDEQLAAIESKSATRVVNAGAGTGKTDTLVWMITDAIVNRSADPKAFTLLVATHAAEGELISRLERMGTLIPQMKIDWRGQVKTFHSKAFSLLNQKAQTANGTPGSKTVLEAMGMGTYTPLGRKSTGPFKNAEDFRAAQSSEVQYFEKLLRQHNITVQNSTEMFQQIQAIKAEHGYEGKYAETRQKGAQLWAQGQKDSFEALFYLYAKALRGDPNFKLHSQQNPRYDLTDAIILAKQAGQKGLTGSFSNVAVDEYQDSMEQALQMIGSHSGGYSYRFFSGDLGQKTIKSGFRTDLALQQAFPQAAQFPLSGNYRMGPINTALYSAIQQEQVLDTRGRAPLQISMRAGGTEAFPSLFTGRDFKAVNERMFLDYLKQKGLSLSQVTSSIHTGVHPLSGAKDPGSAPFVFQTKDQRRYFLKTVQALLAQKVGPAKAKQAVKTLFSLATPGSTTGSNPQAALALLVDQVRSRAFPHVFADVTRVGARWNDADYAEQMGVVFSRPTEQLHMYSSETNWAGSHYNLSPDTLHGQAVPTNAATWWRWMLQNAVGTQGVPLSALSEEDQQLASMPDPARRAVGPESSQAFSQLITHFLKLLPYAQTAVGTGSSGAIQQGGVYVASGATDSGDDAGDSRLAQGLFAQGSKGKALSAALVAGKAGMGADMTRVGLVVDATRQLLVGASRFAEGMDITELMESGMFGYRKGSGERQLADSAAAEFLKDVINSDDLGTDNRPGYPDQDPFHYRGADEEKLRASLRDFLGSSLIQQHPRLQELYGSVFTHPQMIQHIYEEGQQRGFGNVFRSLQTAAPVSALKPGQSPTSRAVWLAGSHESISEASWLKAVSHIRQKDTVFEEEIMEKAAQLLASGKLSPEMLEQIHDVAQELGATRLVDLVDTYGQGSMDPGQGIALSAADLAYIQEHNPREYMVLHALMDKAGLGDLGTLDLTDARVQKQVAQLPYVVGQMQRALKSAEEAKILGIPLAQSQYAPLTTGMATYANQLENSGVLDPDAVKTFVANENPLPALFEQALPGHFLPGEENLMGLASHSLGSAAGLEQLERRRTDMLHQHAIGRIQLSPEQVEQYQGELEQVRALRQTLHDPGFQLQAGHFLNMVQRVATGEGPIDYTLTGEDRERKQPYARFLAPLTNQFREGARTLPAVQELVSALQEGIGRVQSTQMLSRDNVNRVLEALGHDPDDERFGNLRYMESEPGREDSALPYAFTSGTHMPLSLVAGLFPEERATLLSQFTREPFHEGQEVAFLGGLPGFPDVAQLGQAKAGLATGMTGTLGPLEEEVKANPTLGIKGKKGIPFGITQDKGQLVKYGLLTQSEWNLTADKRHKNAQNRWEWDKSWMSEQAEPLAQLHLPGGKSVPVRLSQVASYGASLRNPQAKAALTKAAAAAHKRASQAAATQRATQQARVERWKQWHASPKGAAFRLRHGFWAPGAREQMDEKRRAKEDLRVQRLRGTHPQFRREIPRSFSGLSQEEYRAGVRLGLDRSWTSGTRFPAQPGGDPNTPNRDFVRKGKKGSRDAGTENTLLQRLPAYRQWIDSGQGHVEPDWLSRKSYKVPGGSPPAKLKVEDMTQRGIWHGNMLYHGGKHLPAEFQQIDPLGQQLPDDQEERLVIAYGKYLAELQQKENGRAASSRFEKGGDITRQDTRLLYPRPDLNVAPARTPMDEQGRKMWRNQVHLRRKPFTPGERTRIRSIWGNIIPEQAYTGEGASVPLPSLHAATLGTPKITRPLPAIIQGRAALRQVPPPPQVGQALRSRVITARRQLAYPAAPPPIPLEASRVFPRQKSGTADMPSTPTIVPDSGQGLPAFNASVPDQLGDLARILREGDASGNIPGVTPEQLAFLEDPSSTVQLFGGPGTGKTAAGARRVMYDMATGQALPSQFLGLSVHNATKQAMTHALEPLKTLLPQGAGPEFALRSPMTYHGLASRILFQNYPDEQKNQLRYPILEALGLGGYSEHILEDPTEEDLQNMDPDKRKERWQAGQSFFLQNLVNTFEKQRGLRPSVPDEIRQMKNYISEVKKNRGSEFDTYDKAKQLGQMHLAAGQMSEQAALALYQPALEREKRFDNDDVINYAGQAIEEEGPSAIPSNLRDVKEVWVDEGQDYLRNAKRLLQGFFRALSPNQPRSVVTMDLNQSLMQGMGGIPLEQVGSAYEQTLGAASQHRLTINKRTKTARPVARYNAIQDLLAKHGQIPSPRQIPDSTVTQSGPPDQFLLASNQVDQYRQTFRAMLAKTGATPEEIKTNLAEGRHPFLGIDFSRPGRNRPADIATIHPRNQDIDLFEQVAQQVLRDDYGLSQKEASRTFAQIYRQGNPPPGLSEEQQEAASLQFRGVKFGGIRGLDTKHAFVDANFTGMWAYNNDVAGHLRNLNVGLTRVTEGENVVTAAERPFSKADYLRYKLGRLDLGQWATRQRGASKNAFETYQGKRVPRFFSQIQAGEARYLNEWNFDEATKGKVVEGSLGTPASPPPGGAGVPYVPASPDELLSMPPGNTPAPSSLPLAGVQTPGGKHGGPGVLINTDTINIASKGPVHITNGGTASPPPGASGNTWSPPLRAPASPLAAYAPNITNLPPYRGTPGVAGSSGQGGGGGSVTSIALPPSPGDKKKSEDRINWNSPLAQAGRSLARIGYEMQFVGKAMEQTTNEAISQGSAYRRATFGLAGSGTNGTSGFYDFNNAGFGGVLGRPGNTISGYQNTFLPMYSKTQIAQDYQALTGMTGNPAIGTGALTNIMGLAALAGLDPTQLTGQYAYLAGVNGQAGSAGSMSNLSGMLTSLYGKNLSAANVTPTLSSLQSILPTVSGLAPGQGSPTNQVMAIFSAALQSGMSTQNLPDVASVIGGLSGVGSSPNLLQQQALSQMGYHLTGDSELAQFQQEQTGRQMQLAQYGLMQNINGKGLSLPQLTIQIDKAQVQMDQAQLTMSGLQLQSAQVGQAGAVLNYQYGQASYGFNLAMQNALYGPIGKDYSGLAGYSFQQNQLVARRSYTSPEVGVMFTPQNVYGLKNQEFYAGLQNQQQSLILGRSPLLADALFQQQMKYIAQQADFYKQELALRNQQREFDMVWQKRLLDQQGKQVQMEGKIVAYQGVIYSLQQQQFQLEKEKKAYDEKDAQIQQKYLGQQAADLAAVSTALTQYLNGQGPVRGGNIQPADLLQNLATWSKGKPASALQDKLHQLAPGDLASQNTLYQLVTGLQNHKINLSDLTKQLSLASNKQLLADLQSAQNNGNFTDMISNRTAADSGLAKGGTGAGWTMLVDATNTIAYWAPEIAQNLSNLSGFLKLAGPVVAWLGTITVTLGTLLNVISFVKTIWPVLLRILGTNAPGVSTSLPATGTVGDVPAGAAGGGLLSILGPAALGIGGAYAGWKLSETSVGQWMQNTPVLGTLASAALGPLTAGMDLHKGVDRLLPGLLSLLGLAPGPTTTKPQPHHLAAHTTTVPPTIPMHTTSSIPDKLEKANQQRQEMLKNQAVSNEYQKQYAFQQQQKHQQDQQAAAQRHQVDLKNQAIDAQLKKQYYNQQQQAQQQQHADQLALQQKNQSISNQLLSQYRSGTKQVTDGQGVLTDETRKVVKNTGDTAHNVSPAGMAAGFAAGFAKSLQAEIPRPSTSTGGGEGATFPSHPGFQTPAVNAEFGQRLWYGKHMGVDFAANQGTPLSEFLGGKVTATGFFPWGGEVDVQTVGGLTERYLHLSQIGVTKGQMLKSGQRVGLTGGGTPASGFGYWSHGAHSHVQIDEGNINAGIDPWPIWALLGATNINQFYSGGPGASKARALGGGGMGGEIQHLRNGGIAMRRVISELADGNEPEAVLPLSKLAAVLKSQGSASSIQPAAPITGKPGLLINKIAEKLEVHVHTSGSSLDDRAKDDLMAQIFDVFTDAVNKYNGSRG